ncbi:Uma2 family endonuclease [Sphaerospermopsis sp. LEGE 00249]|uniref:Uma2 family endonuclease n=1 Tax=Sphaerospermopsis sp. LEGE 00249 TaxID=1380707 RepID=UPI00164E7E57|nr:Uma2 family endonuclease [Sphaerospermopsis sp. LEGE 00249]MBC5797286.1 Uma2 family endonuclease [Sphaerospermopsis sp. LEGE 00249]
MTLTKETQYYSLTEYLEFEINSEIRHEYIDGLIIPRTGGTINHNKITGNFYAVVEKQKREQLVEKLRSLSPEQLNALGISLEMLE